VLRSSIMGIRDKARQNLLVGTINVALDRRLMTLDCDPIEDATFEFELVGLLVRAHLRGVGFDEIDVTIIVCPTELGRRFAGVVLFHGFQRFGAATAWGGVERQSGRYLQTTGNYHGAMAVTGKLSKLTLVPNGFGLKPTRDGYDFHRECKAVFGPPRSRHTPRVRI